MTGKHGYTTGLVGNSENVKPMVEHPTLPGILTESGYQTRAQGKMHFSPMRANYGFEHMELPMDYYRERNQNAQLGLPKEHGVGENEIEPVISTVSETDSLTYWTVKRSIDFLETRDDTRPFFLWTSFAKPHPPFDPCANYWNLYRDKTLPAPVIGEWAQTLEQIPQGYLNSTYCLNNAYRMSSEQLQDVKRAYYACITQIDYSLGLLFARMREMNLLENTWILFTTDHGDMMGDHRMAAKSVFFEGSAHIPLIVCPPASSWEIHPLAGEKCNTLVNLADIMPTILEIAGIEVPESVDGVNLLSTMDNQNAEERVFYGDYNHQFFAVISGRYKYMWTSLGGDEFLFDMEEDPKELINLAEVSTAQEQLASLRQKLIHHLEGDKLVENGQLKYEPAPKGPKDVAKWPGFHSTIFPTDVLH